MNDKFKTKKTCRVCFLPIVFKKDCHWEESPNPEQDFSYPLNIHKVGCLDVVRRNGWNIWNVSRRNLNDITNNQQSLFN